MRFSYTLIILFITVLACKSQKDSSSGSAQTSPPLKMLMSDNYGGGPTQEFMVFRDQGTLKKFFIQVNKTRKPGIKPPVVDFSKDLVIIYCSGETYQNELPELYLAKETEGAIILNKRISEVSENQDNKALLMPFGLYIMPFTDKEISLQ